MGHKVRNAYEAQINREKMAEILKNKGMSWADLHNYMVKDYGLDISYKGFMSAVNNSSRWYLTYAMALANIVGEDIKDIFIFVNGNKNSARKGE